jgi:hypothetical protein
LLRAPRTSTLHPPRGSREPHLITLAGRCQSTRWLIDVALGRFEEARAAAHAHRANGSEMMRFQCHPTAVATGDCFGAPLLPPTISARTFPCSGATHARAVSSFGAGSRAMLVCRAHLAGAWPRPAQPAPLLGLQLRVHGQWRARRARQPHCAPLLPHHLQGLAAAGRRAS